MKAYSLLLVFVFLFSSFLNAQNAPVTIVSSQYGVTPGIITVPVKVNGFSSLGAFSLDLKYDPAVLGFVQGIRNSSLYGSFLAGDNLLAGGMRHVVISWFGPATSFPDGSTLFELKFTYTGGTSVMQWMDDGSSCEYADAAYNPLPDMPATCYYQDGIITSDRLLNIDLFIQGLYNPATQQMSQAIENSPMPCEAAIADQVTVELHNAANYSLVEYSASGINLGVDGKLKCNIPAAKSGSYYLTIKHRNSIETVSALPVSLGSGITDYNFVNAASRAFGNNLMQMSDGNWVIFTGDTNQDGIVDSGDMIMVDNDVSGFSTGYIPSDCNGDGLVDSSDMIMVDNNAAAFVTVATP